MIPLHLLIEDPPAKGLPHAVSLRSNRALLAQGRTGGGAGAIDPATLRDRILDDVNTSGPDFLQLGQKIYRWALTGDVATEFAAHYQAAPYPCLHVELASDELEAVPWELLAVPHLRPAALAGLVRLHRANIQSYADGDDWPVRILVLVGMDQKTLGIAEELAAMEKEFVRFGRSVDLHIMAPPTPDELGSWLQKNQPHALHFLGHCVQDPETGTGCLQIEHTQKPWLWKSTDMAHYLTKMKRPFRFVFLNACRTAAPHAQSLSVQRAFVDQGVPVVLAMQANIKGSYAGTFAAGFYSACAEGQDVVSAVSAGRERMYQVCLDGSLDHRDWALPTLTMNAEIAEQGPFHLFTPKPAPKGDEFQRCREFEEARLFADFRDLRRGVTRWFYPLAPNAPETGRNVLLILGEPRCGKSHLVKWCLESFAISGPRIRYVLVSEGKPKNFLELLRQLRDGEAMDQYDLEEYSLLHSGLERAAFKRFNWELNNLLKTGARGEWKAEEHPEPEIADEGLALKPAGENLLAGIYSSYADALRQCAARQPLLLVFDQFSGPQGERSLPVGEFKALVRGLFAPLASDPGAAVRFVFVASRSDYDYYGLSSLPRDRVHTIEVPHEFKGGAPGAERAERMHGFPVAIPQDLPDEEAQHLYRCACEMVWYDLRDAWIQNAAKATATLPAQGTRGLARLALMRYLLQQAGDARWVERMK